MITIDFRIGVKFITFTLRLGPGAIGKSRYLKSTGLVIPKMKLTDATSSN